MPLPNRMAVYLTALAGLATALAPVIANLDTTSTVGVVGGFAGIATVVAVWLNGWSRHEGREAISAIENPGMPVEAEPMMPPGMDPGKGA